MDLNKRWIQTYKRIPANGFNPVQVAQASVARVQLEIRWDGGGADQYFQSSTPYPTIETVGTFVDPDIELTSTLAGSPAIFAFMNSANRAYIWDGGDPAGGLIVPQGICLTDPPVPLILYGTLAERGWRGAALYGSGGSNQSFIVIETFQPIDHRNDLPANPE